MSIVDLVHLSRSYGSDPEWVLAGGGNTSYKDDALLYIKASGFPLATITEAGFARMDRQSLQRIWDASYPRETQEREAAALADLMAARVAGEEKRPSVETLMHELFPYALVVHTHPALVNGLTCSHDGEAACRRLFGDDALWVPAIEPGYVLAQAMHTAAASYAERHGHAPRIAILQNHGLVVAADTGDEIDRLQRHVVDTVRRELAREPDMSVRLMDAELGSWVNRTRQAITAAIDATTDTEDVVFGTCPEVAARLESRSTFAPLAGAFTPDHIVYSGSMPLWIDDESDLDATLPAAIARYRDEYRVDPRIIAVRRRGVFAVAGSKSGSQTAYELFLDQVKIAAYAEAFGGARHLDPHLVAFIESWEVERYRKKMSTGGQ